MMRVENQSIYIEQFNNKRTKSKQKKSTKAFGI